MTRHFARSTLFVMAGLLIWAADFLFTYVFTALAIARGFNDMRVLGAPVVELTVAIATVIALAATAAVLRAALHRYHASRRDPQREVDRFVLHLAAAVSGLALLAIAWNGLVIWLP